MSTSATPALTPFSQNMTPLPGFDTDRSVTIHWIVRDISPPHATLMPPRTFQCTKLIQLSSFQFQPPYARDQYVVVFNQFYMLTARIPIAWQDINNEMDFLAVLVHREGSLEETVMIPVPVLFFEDHFLPDNPSSSSPSPSSSSSSTIIPNSSLPIPPPTSVMIAEPPSIHDYPPPTPHTAQQLGEAYQSPSQTWKELMEELWIANTGRNITSSSRNYGSNPIIEPHIPQSKVNAQFSRQSTPALSINAQLDGAVVDMTSEYSGIQQMVRQALQNASLEDEPEKSFLAKAGIRMGNPPTYGGERNLEKFENWVATSKIQLQLLGQCLTDEAQEWFYWQVERFDREVKHWDLESVLMGLQKWFMPTLLLNKVAVSYDHLMQGSMNVQQLHQQLTKLAKQMVELPDVYSYWRRFMNALTPSIREEVLGKGFTAEFSKIDKLVEQAVIVDNVKCYTSGYNSNQSSAYANKPATVDHKRVQQSTTLNRSSNANAGSSNQHRSGNNNFQNRSTPQLMLAGGGNVRNNNPTYSRNPVKPGNTVNRPTQSNPIRTAPKANNPVDRRIAGARIEEVIFEEDEGQMEEFDEYAPHPEEQQEFEDQPEEDDQQYRFNDDEEYEMRSIDNDVVHVNAVIKASGYNDLLQTGGKEQPVYDHRARKKACPLPTRGKENETISVFWDIGGTKAHCLLDSGCEGIMISSDFVRANKLPKFELEKPVILQLACVGSKSTVQYGLTTKILLSNEKYDEYFDITNVDSYDVILGTPFLRRFEILLDFKDNRVQMGKFSFPNQFGSLTPTEADENEDCL
ncbi:hypothetical protein M422DRAFT_272082 [Sphaerobolus stellatus SS14]|uniref:Uncharacterized protein n=1 Tax=Sphaerobolus stellatus (strain SS14) TaxID=990650 RepID=A0A0C9TY95_SPHS4|nr:hypothetical protein M422DRAFT_272082 [Sphaerobolus stellatus SS14]